MQAEGRIRVLQCSEKWPFSFTKGWSFFSHYTAVDGGVHRLVWVKVQCDVWRRSEDTYENLHQSSPI